MYPSKSQSENARSHSRASKEYEPLVEALAASEFFPFWKGRVAFYNILRAAGVGEGDEVILPAFTCVVVPSAIVYLGARPVYVDIDPATFNLNPTQLAEKISDRTKVIVAQHTFGLLAPMDEIRRTAERAKRPIRVVEDAAHAFGSVYHGKAAGRLGDAAFFSTQWSKPFTTGLGGFAVVEDSELRKRLRELHATAESPNLFAAARLQTEYFVHSILYRPQLFWLAQGAYRLATRIGFAVGSSSAEELEIQQPRRYAWRMHKFQERVLVKKMRQAGEAITHRRKLAEYYRNELQRAGFETPRIEPHSDPVFLRFPLLVADKRAALAQARRLCLEIGDWFVSPVHPIMSGWEKVGYRAGSCPVAEAVCQHVINLPTHTGIGAAEAERVVRFVRQQTPWSA